jgi:hypothetical protein
VANRGAAASNLRKDRRSLFWSPGSGNSTLLLECGK